MIEILVCDDDNKIINQVKQLLKDFQKQTGIELSVICRDSPESVLKEVFSYDIAILDVEMPGANGLRVAEYLKSTNKEILIIVLTSFMEYLDNAMRINVFRYLSKPIERKRFLMNVSEAVAECQQAGKYILVESEGDVIRLKTNDILYIENMRHGSIIVTKTLSYKTNKKPAVWMQEINMDDCFVYSHKSYIVNLQNVVKISKKRIVFMTDQGEIEFSFVSQSKYNSLKTAFYYFVGAKI